MGGENVEQLWYGLCLIETVVTLFVVSVVVLLCKRFLRRIACNRAKRRSAKRPMVHSLGGRCTASSESRRPRSCRH